MNNVRQQAQTHAERPGQGPRQRAHVGAQCPERKILELVSHRRETLDCTIGGKIIQIRKAFYPALQELFLRGPKKRPRCRPGISKRYAQEPSICENSSR